MDTLVLDIEILTQANIYPIKAGGVADDGVVVVGVDEFGNDGEELAELFSVGVKVFW